MELLIVILCSFTAVLSIVSLIVCYTVLAKQTALARQKADTDVFTKELDRMRNEINTRFDSIQSALNQTIANSFVKNNELLQSSLDGLRRTLDMRIEELRQGNEKKLGEIQKTVDEKLQETLEKRISESFKNVSENLERVYTSIGEMKTLAAGVDDLKKVLGNVKTRGVFGEVQLERILEQILTPDQYDKNVKTKKSSNDPVEFAIKIPSKDENGRPVYLPIDAKFPLDKYERLTDAYNKTDIKGISEAKNDLFTFIKNNAKIIHDKYIDVPATTGFALMFLPTEGLYAEVVQHTELLSDISSKYNVNVVGPSTTAAFLNSLQMGFHTLAIEKRSGEVWTLLGAIKTEFDKFGGVLTGLQRKIGSVDDDLEKLVGTRTRMIINKLKRVQELPANEASAILSDAEDTVNEDENDLP